MAFPRSCCKDLTYLCSSDAQVIHTALNSPEAAE